MIDYCVKGRSFSFWVSSYLQSSRIYSCSSHNYPLHLAAASTFSSNMLSNSAAVGCEKGALMAPCTCSKFSKKPLSALPMVSNEQHLSCEARAKKTRSDCAKRRYAVGVEEGFAEGDRNEKNCVKVYDELARYSVDESDFDFVSIESVQSSGRQQEPKSTCIYKGSPSTPSTSDLDEWCTYLLLSGDSSKTYVGVTCNMNRRLKQHNGEIRGGAKAARAGRPWRLACTIHGFGTRSEAADLLKGAHLMQRRQVALEKVQNKDTAWKRLKVHWHL
ncbi:hypothetical protein O6H91_17G042900 [Diphasiastrum complanatum]|uniref:Uncharacterized protein n=1 Tax=Diphasiastrum complanatum TaxID=34168 RepID=A0ACC2B643_DIPCM|nr:hypothetical protein O6H91_17G042900 [Diphasiastrum complanatum]